MFLHNTPHNLILSIYGSHDASATFVDKQGILRVIEYERFVKRRYSAFTHKFDKQADSKLFCSNQQERVSFLHYIQNTIGQVPDYILYEELDIQDIRLVQSVFPGSCMVYMNRKHHTCHAASAYYTSPYTDALIISYDGGGGEDNVTYTRTYAGTGDTLSVLQTYPIDFGTPYALIGIPISEITTPDDLVINLLSNAGKVMGLCAYGTVRTEWIEPMRAFYINEPYLGWQQRLELLGNTIGLTMNRNALSGQISYDLAAMSQYMFETLFFETFGSVIEQHNNIIITGGCAMNVLLNQKVRERYPAKQFYIPSMPSDCGLSLGQLLYATGTRCPEIVYNGLEILDTPTIPDQPYSISELCDMLLGEAIVGVIQGMSEVGPRALGNRSIICIPGVGMKDKLNVIKHREWFRPFAPVCRYEDMDRYFEQVYPSPYMSYCPAVRQEYRDRLPAITHTDGTARLQTVTADSHPFLYELLTELEQRGAIPVILNTSFNIKGKPIISTYRDAMTVLKTTELSAIYSNNQLYRI